MASLLLLPLLPDHRVDGHQRVAFTAGRTLIAFGLPD
jgi:hypothetical protein